MVALCKVVQAKRERKVVIANFETPTVSTYMMVATYISCMFPFGQQSAIVY